MAYETPNPIVQYTTPVTTDTINVTPGRNVLVLVNPAGTIAALTIAFPGSPLSGDLVTIASSQIVATLTLNGGTLIGALTAFAVAGFATYIYNSTATKWFRVG